MVVKTDNLKQNLQNAPAVGALQELIEKSVREFKRALPEHMRAERLVRIALTCIRQTPELAQCTPESFVGALLVSAQFGLEPVGGRAYILPYKNGKTGKTEAQFIQGYRGIADLFYRHEKSVQLNWGKVHEHDEFSYEYGTNAFLRHRPALKDRGLTIAYYVIAELEGGAKPFLVMSRDECLEHGKRHSKTYFKDQWDNNLKKRVPLKDPHFADSSPWKTDEDSMCLKTVLIQLCKVLPLSMEIQKAISADETSREYREGIIADSPVNIQPQNWNEQEAVETTGEQVPPEKEAPATTGTITKDQLNAINQIAQGMWKDGWAAKLANRVGSDFGVDRLEMISKEQAADLIRALSKERADA